MLPLTTRLRFIKADVPEQLTLALSKLKFRVQIYGSPVFDGEHWFLFFVPPDDESIKIENIDLTI